MSTIMRLVERQEVAVSYDQLLTDDELTAITTRFLAVHPDLLPIVIVRALRESWVGELTAAQVKQALRDCYDMTKRVENLYSPVGFVRNRLHLCLENQTLGFLRTSPDSDPPIPEGPQS